MIKIIKLISLALVLVCILTGCENNTSEVFDHGAIITGYINFEEAEADSVIAEVSILKYNMTLGTTYTDETGFYQFSELSSGEYTVSAEAAGYSINYIKVNLTMNEIVQAEPVMLELVESMSYGTRSIDGSIDEDWLPVYEDDHVSSWGAEDNDFHALYISRDENYIYFGITGQFSSLDNSVTLAIDKDFDAVTGINDFSGVDGGDIGGWIKKDVTAPDDFGADLAFNAGYSISGGEGVVSLEDPEHVDENFLEDTAFALTDSTLEFKISLEEIYNGNLPDMISLIAYIGGNEPAYFANDVIPQNGQDFDGEFQDVFMIKFE